MKNSKEVILTSDNTGETWSIAAWDPSTGSLLSTYRNAGALEHHTLQILGESYIIAADVTKPRLYLWPLNSQSPVPNLRLPTLGKVSALACTRDGDYTALAIGEKILVWQLTTGKSLTILARHYQTVTCLTFSHDGANFASGGEDGLVFVWSLTGVTANHEQCAPTHGFSDHSLPVKDLHYGNFSLNSQLISVSLDRTARIYDINAGILLLTLIFDAPLTSVCMDIRENDLYVGTSNGSILNVNLRDPPRGNDYHVTASSPLGKRAFLGHTGSITALSVSTDCRILLSGSTDRLVHLWDIPSRQIIKTINHKGPITSAKFVPAFQYFHDTTHQPKIQVHPLQRTFNDSGKAYVIECINVRDDSHLLNVETYLEVSHQSPEVGNDCYRKLTDARNEIETLRVKNSKLYKYAVKMLTTKVATNKIK